MDRKSLFLIQTPYVQAYGSMKKAAGTYFPLGLGYLAAYVRKKGYAVRFYDPNVQNTTIEEIAAVAKKENPLMIGISFMTPQFLVAKTYCETLKSLCPNIPIVLGGPHPSVMPTETLERISSADFVVVGEGEETLGDLLRAFGECGVEYGSIPGIAWRKDESVILNTSRPPILDLDCLPCPDRSLIDQSFYRTQSFLSYSPRTVTVYTSRGCPGRCVFCCSGHRLRSKVRERSIANVMEEIDQLVEQFDLNYLLIKDDTFTLKRSRTEEFCDEIKSRHPSLRWHCMGRINTVDKRLLGRMKSAGLHDIFFGIESGNDEILRKAGKGITISQVREVVSACARLGVRTYGAFILGLPGETRKTIEETISFACELPLTMAGFSIMIPYPGTKSYEDYFETAYGESVDYSDFVASTGLNYVANYTGLEDIAVEELPHYIARAQRRFYLRPRQVWRMIHGASWGMMKGYARGASALLSKQCELSSKKWIS